MANYHEVFKTNTFSVTDAEVFEELCKGFKSNVEVCRTNEENGYMLHGDDSFDWFPPVSDEDCQNCRRKDGCEYAGSEQKCRTEEAIAFGGSAYAFFNEMQKIIPDGRAFVLYEIWHEKHRDVGGCVSVVTKKGVEVIDLARVARQTAEKHGARV